ncbi:hypothetical protein [Streptomyces sp. JJ38]|uniref:hypothetical protein n=1 Tax=Streptomyces sp. JJ38 TaxID=2738128 RepID=UPI001C56A8D4|nr:hypothetical protein [Streptomyces sp. JJ38]MBW1597552.1 hypothetical protein [Streptomyces sp. JJ38]
MSTAAGAHVPTHRLRDGHTGLRLRWWALPLPVAVFAALTALLLLGDGSASPGATAEGLGGAAAALWHHLSSLGPAGSA